MRYPTTHSFLKWAGPTAFVFLAGCLALVAAFAQTYDGVKNWAQKLFDQWWPVVSAPWFLIARIVVICAYIWALVWTGRERKPAIGIRLYGYGLRHLKVSRETSGAAESKFFPLPPTNRPVDQTVRARGKSNRAAQFHDAILAFRHIANARELWCAERNRKPGQPSPLGSRPLEIINQIRSFFPPEAPGDHKEDQVSRLWGAAMSYGRTLGYGHGETERLRKLREAFELELQSTIKLFEELNGTPKAEVDLAYQQEASRQKAKRDAANTQAANNLAGELFGGMAHAAREISKERDTSRSVLASRREERERQAVITKAEIERANLIASQQRRREVIAKGRDVVLRFRQAGELEGFEEFASKDRDYLDIQPHLGDEYQAERIRNARRATATADGRDYRAAMLLRELARLEKEWGLI